MRTLIAVFLTAVTLTFGATAASAADWTVTKLRGTALILVDGDWRPLARGTIVPEHRVVRTLGGRVTLQRGKETIDLGPQTAVSIDDKAGAKPFTTVTQHFGEVAVEAEVKDVRHFAVETPYLVAVVKGTRFVVKSDGDGSIVVVRRGAVLVVDSESSSSVTVVAGQSASAHDGEQLTVAGRGDLPEVASTHGKSGNAANAAGSPGTPSANASENAVGAAAAAANSNGNSSHGSGHGKSPV